MASKWYDWYSVMVIFNVDLDNTIIYSYKHDIGSYKRCAEIYNGREISFITDRTYKLLKEVSEKVLIVPTTTRTIEQYSRIDLGIKKFKYVLVCNGGVLLTDGKEDSKWYETSLSLIAQSQLEIDRAYKILESDKNRIFELRYIKELFLFTKSSKPETTVKILRQNLDLSLVDVLNNGIKVYVMPKNLDKGTGVKRLRQKLSGDIVIAAGDSAFDIPMLEYANYSVLPSTLDYIKRETEKEKEKLNGNITVIDKKFLFSEKLLERVLEIV